MCVIQHSNTVHDINLGRCSNNMSLGVGDSSRKRRATSIPDSPTQKRTKLLLDNESSDNDSDSSGGVSINKDEEDIATDGFTVNQDFARRFEHNKKREELHRCTFSFLLLFDGKYMFNDFANASQWRRNMARLRQLHVRT